MNRPEPKWPIVEGILLSQHRHGEHLNGAVDGCRKCYPPSGNRAGRDD